MNKQDITDFLNWYHNELDPIEHTREVIAEMYLSTLPKAEGKTKEETLARFIIQFPEDGIMTDESIKRNVYKAMTAWGDQVRCEIAFDRLSEGENKNSISDINALEKAKTEIAELKQKLETYDNYDFLQKEEITSLKQQLVDEETRNISAEIAIDSLKKQLSMKEDDHRHTVLELKKQLSEKEKQYLSMAKIAREAAEENAQLRQRLLDISDKANEISEQVVRVKALEKEVERLKDAFNLTGYYQCYTCKTVYKSDGRCPECHS